MYHAGVPKKSFRQMGTGNSIRTEKLAREFNRKRYCIKTKRTETLKIVITAQGKEKNSKADPRFGRAQYFILIDTVTGSFTAHDNSQNLNALQGAGIQAAKNVSDLGAEAVVSGNVGPKAFAALQAAGIAVYTGASGTVQETLEAFLSDELEKASKATVEGHW